MYIISDIIELFLVMWNDHSPGMNRLEMWRKKATLKRPVMTSST